MKVKVLKVLGLSWLLAVQGLEPTLATSDFKRNIELSG